MKKFLLTGVFAIAALLSFGQATQNHCGTDEHLAEQLRLDEGMQAAKAKFDAQFKEFISNYNPEDYKTKTGLGKASTPKYIIPVVVHVFHANGQENISDLQIQSEINFLNKSFRNLVSDSVNRRAGWLRTSATDSVWFDFKSLAADMEIEFRLARKDPDQKCTNGIVRLYTPLTQKGNDDLKKLSVWDTKHYFNMWICKQINKGNTIGIAGYAQFPFGPGGGSGTDGVIIISNEFGNTGTSQPGQTPNVTTVTHEAGHWFGLYHPFQIKSDSCGIDGDEVFDTPPTYFSPSSSEPLRNRCNQPRFNSCANDKPDYPDLQEAYMDYFIGSCASNMFTLEQKARAHFVLNNFRQQLWSAENLALTGVDTVGPTPCAPIAAFNAPSTMTCAGNKLAFFDYSYNGAVSSYEWTFPGGNPGTSNSKTPTAIQYDNPGTYDVTLKVTGPNGSHTTTLKNYITILPAMPSLPAGYYTADWWYENNWQQSGWVLESDNLRNPMTRVGVSYNKIASMKLTQDPFNSKNTIGSLYSLISPSFNLSGASSPYFAFHYAFAQATLPANVGGGQTADELRVYTSIDCGKTWQVRETRSGTNISTIGTGSAAVLNSAIDFVPADQSKWKEVIISGVKVPTNQNVRFKIEFKYSGGNNFYLDNVHVGLKTGINDVKLADQLHFTASPNPFNTFTTIGYELSGQEHVKIRLVDVLGKEIAMVYDGNENAGTQNHVIEKNSLGLTPGFYIIELQVGNSILTHKIAVE